MTAKKKKKKKELDISDIFDLEEKKSKMPSIEVASTADIKECISSGFLSWDLVVGGGYQRGVAYQIVGPEYAGKSTGLFHAFSSALRFIPNHLKGIFIDVEGLDPVWFGNICKCKNIKKIFGKRDEVTHKWIIKPQVRHYKPSFGEQGLKFLKRVLKRLPNKVLVGNYWYYVWEPREPKKVKKTGGYTATELRKLLEGRYSKKLYTKYGNYCVPIKDNYAGPEILIGVDSWAAMTPESIAEDDSGAMAQQARMFGKHLNDIKSLISAKGCTMIGTNQVRQNPGQRFGNPEYNPGGNTLKHITDCRIRVQSVANQNGKGLTELEGADEYRWFKVKTIKNKLFIPYKETKGRWWIGHGGESGFGVDIVQDTLEYLKMTGQFRGKKKGFQIKLVGKNKKCKKVSNVTFTYDSFKKAILNPGKINIRELCFKQLRSGRGMKLYSTGGET